MFTTVKDLYDSIDALPLDSRNIPLLKLSKLLSPISMATLRTFQETWDSKSRTFEEFVIA